MEDFEQKMQQWRKEDHEWKQKYDEICKKERELDEKILTSISKLVQSIQKFKEASDSSVAPQMFDEKSEQKPEPTDFNFEGKTKEIMEQLSKPNQTDSVGAVNLLVEKGKSEKMEEQPSLMNQTTEKDIPLNDVFDKKSEIVTLVEVFEENVELEEAYVQGIVEDVEKQHSLKEPFKFTVFSLHIKWTVSVPKPFQVH